MRRLTTVLFVAAGLLTVSVSLSAHHGNAAYDYSKTVTVKGTVTEWLWANPHCWLKLDAQDENGKVQHWILEGGNPPDMVKIGYGKTVLKPGDVVTVDVMPTKNGTQVGRIRQLVLPNGTVLKGGSSNTNQF